MCAEVPFPAQPCPIRLGPPDLGVPRTPHPFGYLVSGSGRAAARSWRAWEALAGVAPATSDPSLHGSCEGHGMSPGAAVLVLQT